MGNHCLQEANQLDGVVLIWFGQVDFLEHDDLTVAAQWLQDASAGRARLLADLRKLLNDGAASCLAVAVNGYYLALLALLKFGDAGIDKNGLSTTFLPDHYEVFASSKPRLDDS